MTAHTKTPDNLAHLQDVAYSFEFDQMMYLLQQLSRVSGQHETVMRLMSHIHLNWPPSDIHRVRIDLQDFKRHEVHVNFMGLAGAQGPLPITVTEKILSRLRDGDTSFQDFLNIFNQRLLQLLHGVHKKLNPLFDTRPAAKTIHGQTLLAISGVAGDYQADRHHFADRSLLAYAGLLWMRPRSAQGLVQVLTDYFQRPFAVLGHRGRWCTLSPHDRSRLGKAQGAQNRLGQTAALGTRCWDETYYFVLSCGPLDLNDYVNFLPTGANYPHLRDFLKLYVHVRASTQITVRIRPDHVKAMRLDGAARLGWTSWLQGQSKQSRDFQTQLIFA